MRPHPVTVAVAVYWAVLMFAAWLGSGWSAAAGRLPDAWTGPGIGLGFANVAVVVAGAWFAADLPVPRIFLRLAQIVGMAGALWATGTLTRALYYALG